MAVDGFLVYPDIPGESQRRGHEDEIEIHDVTFAMASPQTGAGAGGMRRGRVVLRPVTVRKHYDRSSPHLKKALNDGRFAPEVTITLTRSVDGNTSDYLVVVLKEANVVGYELSTTDDGQVEESLTLSYRTIRFTYQDTDEVELEAEARR